MPYFMIILMVYLNLLKFSSFIFYNHPYFVARVVEYFSSVIFHVYPFGVSTAATRIETSRQTARQTE